MNTKYFLVNNQIDIGLDSEIFILPNGLTVVVHCNPNASVAAVNMTYKVGAKDEPNNKTGIAHLCEHLMFGGTSALPGSFLENMLKIGAVDVNGVTSRDRTNYHQTVLPGALDFTLFAESDRMSYFGENLTIELLDQQRSVVINEKNERESTPLGRIGERRCQATFPALHPYAHTVIGSKSHLESITIDEMKEWFRTYYVPSNAILVIAGCVDFKEIKNKVTSFFGDIPGGTPLLRPAIDYSPISSGKREIVEARITQPAIHLTWNLPPFTDDSAMAFSVLSTLLGKGNEAFLHKKLVIDAEVASQVSAYIEHGTLCSQFTITAVARENVLLVELENTLLIAIEELKVAGINDDAIEKVRALSLSDFIWLKESMTGIADLLGWFSFTYGDPAAYKKFFNILFSFSSQSFSSLASDWLNEYHFTMHIVPFLHCDRLIKSSTPLSIPPVVEPGEVNFAKAESFILSNGSYLSHIQCDSVPGTLVRIILPRGTCSSYPDIKGITSIVCQLLMSDSQSGDTVKKLEKIGGSFSIESGVYSTNITLKTLSASLNQSLNYLLEHILNATLSEKEFERIKSKSILDIVTQVSSENGVINYLLSEFIFPEGHPYKNYNSGRGTPETLKNITYDQVINEREVLTKTSGVKIITVSNLNAGEVIGRIEDNISDWILTLPAEKQNHNAKDYNNTSPRALLIHKPESIQSLIVAAKTIPPFEEETHATFNMVSKIFSSSFNSRLNLRLREKLNWTYGVQGATTQDSGLRMHVIKTSVQKDRTLETIDEIKKAFVDLNNNSVTEKELKSQLLSEQFRLNALASDSESILSFQTFIEQNNLKPDYWFGYADALGKINDSDLERVIKNYFHPEAISWVIVGDLYKLESDLRLILPESVELIKFEDVL